MSRSSLSHMDTTATHLHILTSLSERTPQQLQEAGRADDGDVIADFRRFPPSVWQVQPDAKLEEITSCLAQSRDYWTPVREWLVRFTAQTGLQDVLQIEGYGVWWTLNAQKFVPGLTEVGNAFVWIDLLKALSEKVSPTAIVTYGPHAAMVHLAEQIFPSVGMQVAGGEDDHSRERSQPRRKPLLLLARVLLSIAYLIYTLIRRPDICVLTSTNLLRRATDQSDEKLDDVYLGSVAHCVRHRGWRVAVVEKYGWNASWKGLVARGFFFPSDLLYALSTPLLRKIGPCSGSVRHWCARWAGIRPKVESHLRYRDCDIAPLVLPIIAREFNHSMAAFEAHTGLWRRILALWRPEVIYLNNSYGRAALASIIAAKTLDIPTVEQQHGLIGKNHFAYLVPRQLHTAVKYPLCDRMAVWGDNTRRFLTAAEAYEPSQLAVCGFPRIDTLLNDLPPRVETLGELGIPNDASVVLYTPNRFAEAFRSGILDSIQRTKASPHVRWIMKPHPAVKTRQQWQAAINRRQLETVKVVSGARDFYALLAACDVHVTFASTTLIEAAVLGKPNVGLSTPSTADPAGYAEAKAYLPVHPAELGPVVTQLLDDQAWQQRLLRMQRASVADWCLHDGQAVDRIVALIETTVNESTEERQGSQVS